MKLLADENFPPSLISYLQRKRYNVKRIQRSTEGVSDSTVRKRAEGENRVIVTFDKDFLASDPIASVSVVIFDFPNTKPENVIPYMGAIVNAIKHLKRKKKPFVAVYSKDGLEVKE